MAAKRRLGVVYDSVLCSTGGRGAKLRWQRSDGSALCLTRCCVRRVDAERTPLAEKRRLGVVCDSVLCATGGRGAKLRWQRSDDSALCVTRCCVRRMDAERSSAGSEAMARRCV